MKERPILFSAPMVRAILEGRKTQTRRAFNERTMNLMRAAASLGEVSWFMNEGCLAGNDLPYIQQFSPYGQPGDRLWVRETWGIGSRPDPWGGYDGIEYRADEAWLEDGDDLPCRKVQELDHVCLSDYRSGWKPGIHMPRWASRILLDVTAVRVERLQDISETDALDEGIQPFYSEGSDPSCYGLNDDGYGFGRAGSWKFKDSAKQAYETLWERINGAGSWAVNPWVWVIEFREAA